MFKNYFNFFSRPDTITFLTSIFPLATLINGSPFFIPTLPKPLAVLRNDVKSPIFESMYKVLKISFFRIYEKRKNPLAPFSKI